MRSRLGLIARRALNASPWYFGLSCHREERSDAAISIVVPNWPEIASLRSQ
jgi:hypothetical protein